MECVCHAHACREFEALVELYIKTIESTGNLMTDIWMESERPIHGHPSCRGRQLNMTASRRKCDIRSVEFLLKYRKELMTYLIIWIMPIDNNAC